MIPTLQAKSAAGEERERSDARLHLETTTHDGGTGNIVRDSEGNTIWPGYVPPEVVSPEHPRAKTPDPEPPSLDEGPRRVGSEPQSEHGAQQTPNVPKRAASRPSVDKRSATEAPRRGARQTSTFPPAPRRAGTSYLNQTIWRYGDDTSSSSSSSDDDNETHQEQARTKKKGRRRSKHDPEDQYRRFRVGNENYKTKGKVKPDGRLRITVNETANTGYLAKALGAAAKRVVPGSESDAESKKHETSQLAAASGAISDRLPPPSLNIVIMVIGSRGDAQPFLKIGKVLKEQGHRVRIATHPAFRDFVEKDSELEFFSVGGDPSELMAFMVKNPGMIPTLETVKAGDIGRRRAAMAEMFDGFWRACINATDDEKDTKNIKMMGEKRPFVADAIIANPPSFAHIHCAEALGIPLHLMFTFPYTPTQDFPHPLASIKKSNVDPGYTNFISYPLVEMMVWQGLGDLVNEFRVTTLGLDPVSTLWAPGATYRLHVPFSYLWSPGIVPKPRDWGSHIDVSGFVFLDLASSFKPPDALEEFLDGGEEPIYIGFGSIVVDDAAKFTQMIFDAVKLAGVRALVSKGWGGFGSENVPENIYMLGNTPHDWLFPKVKACVIHGGAGTTAIALKCGKPTMVVPFFGDQHFWGSMVANAGAGPEPVPYKNLTAEKLAEGIKYCLTEQAQEAAGKIADSIEKEGDGAVNAVKSFHKHLNLKGERSMRCSLIPERVAVWSPKRMDLKLSALAADILVDRGLITWKKLRLLRHAEWNDFEGPGEPVTGVAGSLIGTAGDVFGGIGSVPYRLAKTSQKIKERKAKRREARQKRHARRLEAKGKQKQREADGAKPPDTQARDHAQSNGSAAEPNKANGSVPHGSTGNNNQTGRTSSNAAQSSKQNSTLEPERQQATRRDTTGTASIYTQTTLDEDNTEEYVNQVASGVGKSASALAKAPVDLSLALAQGFHNAPRLYGDDTVRRPPRVTGFRSGLRAARFEFAYGVYDGWTGVVRHPVRGAKRDGVKGFVKGTGMGLTGFVLKDFAAIVGPIAYTMKGVVKQAERHKQPSAFIRKARIVQGQRANARLSKDEHKRVEEDVLRGWKVMKELDCALEAERNRRGIAGVIMRKKTKSKVSAAFENTHVAQRVLEGIRKGDTVESVLGVDSTFALAGSSSRERMEMTDQAVRQAGEEVEAQAEHGGRKESENGEGKPVEDAPLKLNQPMAASQVG